jgi:hypothetical protein
MAWTRRGAIIACPMLSGCEQPVAPPASATLVRAMAIQVTNFDSSGSLTGEIQARYESDLGFRMAPIRPAMAWRSFCGWSGKSSGICCHP